MRALAVAAAAAFGLAACSVDHRSDQFACEVTADCDGDRICDDGFCVGGDGDDGDDGQSPDARVDAELPVDADSCPAPCTSCDLDALVCVVECGDANHDCEDEVVCPSGWACDVRCSPSNSCRNGVRCEDSTSCTIACTGQGSCRGLTCGEGRCTVECSAPGACRNVDCGDSCACDVSCDASNTCGDAVTCPFTCDSGAGCTSEFPQCDQCAL